MAALHRCPQDTSPWILARSAARGYSLVRLCHLLILDIEYSFILQETWTLTVLEYLLTKKSCKHGGKKIHFLRMETEVIIKVKAHTDIFY